MTRMGVIALAVLAALLGGAPATRAADECLVGFEDQNDTPVPESGPPLCLDGQKICTFNLKLCLNSTEADCSPATFKKKKIRAKGHCGPVGKVFATPNGTSESCGAAAQVKVRTKKNGTRDGSCKISVSSGKTSEGRKDLDKITLLCKAQAGSCPATTTTTTPGGTTTTTAPPGGCCGAARIETTSSAGTLEVSTIPAFPFPPNVQTIVDVGAADAGCKHTGVVPPGGFAVPTFCIPSLGFSSDVLPTGCESGGADGAATVWDSAATAPDPDVTSVGDTSDPDGNNCGTLGTGCVTAAGGAGSDNRGNANTTLGGAPHTGGKVHTQVGIPVHSITWVDGDGACPDADGVFDPGTDTPVTEFDFILTPTTGHTSATFTDLNGDGCIKAGNGPNNKTGDGIPADGPCCTVGQATTVAATATAFTGGAPLYDITFKSITPTTISACGPSSATQTCTLSTNACLQ